MPMALGHEAAGEVVEVGDGVTAFAPGDHVVLAFVPVCGECAPVRRRAAPRCASRARRPTPPGRCSAASGATGAAAVHHHLGVSAFAEHIVVSERSAVRVDDDLPFEIAALFGCAVLTGVGAALNATTIAPGDRVAVFGLGGVGLAALMGARARRARR